MSYDDIVALIGFTEPVPKGKPPWKDLKVPPFEEKKFGKWSIKKHNTGFIRGYFRGMQELGEYFVMTDEEKGTIFMSTTPMELESQMPHVHSASGKVVIAGIGMGVALYNIMQKTNVTNVIAFDIDVDVVSMVRDMMYEQKWKGRNKVVLLPADVLNLELKVPDVDFLYVDIWPILLTPKAIPDTQEIQRRIGARTVGFWGQELEFIDWMRVEKLTLPPTFSKMRRWVKAIGLPLVVRKNWNYPYWSEMAARQVSI